MSHMLKQPPQELFVVQLGPDRFKTFVNRGQLREFLRDNPRHQAVSRSVMSWEGFNLDELKLTELYVYRMSVFERMPYPAFPDSSRTAIYEVVLSHGGERMLTYLLHIFNRHVFGSEFGREKDGLRFDSHQPLRRVKGAEVFGELYAYRLVRNFPDAPCPCKGVCHECDESLCDDCTAEKCRKPQKSASETEEKKP